tara:strand:+ start:595 stop:879 length:285 start_codon:yes stop_codon:yes gene_type:complete
MYFIVYAKDKPGHTQLRIETRPDHVTWLKKSPVPVAGPLLAADNETMIGSMLIVEADSRADVEALLPNDPYAIVDLFESVEIHPWKWAIGSPAA